MRYQFESASKNTDEVTSQIKGKIVEHLVARFGDDFKPQYVTISIEPNNPDTIYSEIEDLREAQKSRKLDEDPPSQGTLFEFLVTWFQPIAPSQKSDSPEKE